MLSHDLARALLARRDNDIRIEVLTEAPDGDTFLLRRVDLRDSASLAAEERTEPGEVVGYDADRDVIVIRAGFVVAGESA